MTIQEEQLKEAELSQLDDDAELLLAAPAFNQTINNFADQAFCDSKPEQTIERQRTYAHFRASVKAIMTNRRSYPKIIN